MKSLLTILGIILSLNSFTQQLFSPTLPTNNAPYLVNIENNYPQYHLWSESENYASSSVSSATDVVLWSEDFANGLSGNNTSSTQTWTVAGGNDDLWEHDDDGSAGPFAGSSPVTLDSETKDNGWMIFDADKGNLNLPQSAFTKKHGELISPSIDLSSDTNVTLKFTHLYRYCCSTDHKLKVSVFDGSNWSNGIDVNIGGVVNIVKETNEVKLNITQYAALKSDVKIKFTWEANTAEAYYWMIDDVKILKTNAYEANLLDAFYVTPGTSLFGGTSYRLMNLEQAEQTEYYFAGILQNSGYNNIDSARVYAKVDGESGTYQSNGVQSIPTGIDTLYSNEGFTPSSVGTYYSKVYGDNDNNQIDTDTSQLRFEITEYEYGKDNGNYNQGNFGTIPVNDDGRYEVGNRFRIHKSADIQAVKIRLDSRTGSDAKGSIKIYEFQADGSRNFVFESQIENLGQNTGSWFTFKFDSKYPLSANVQYLVVLYSNAASTANDSLFLSSGGFVNPQESFLQDIDGVGDGVATGTWFYISIAPCIRLDFEEQIGIEDKFSFTELSLYPNPNNGVFTLKIKTEKAENLFLNVRNIIGQIVYSETLSKVNDLNKELNLTHLEKGMYLVNLVSQKGNTSTHKVVIK